MASVKSFGGHWSCIAGSEVRRASEPSGETPSVLAIGLKCRARRSPGGSRGCGNSGDDDGHGTKSLGACSGCGSRSGRRAIGRPAPPLLRVGLAPSRARARRSEAARRDLRSAVRRSEVQLGRGLQGTGTVPLRLKGLRPASTVDHREDEKGKTTRNFGPPSAAGVRSQDLRLRQAVRWLGFAEK